MRILCVEPKEYFIDIIDNDSLNDIDVEFDGYKFYGKNTNWFNKYDAVLSVQYLWPVSNIVVSKSKAAGIPTYLLTDGIIEWNNCFYHPAVLKSKKRLFQYILHDFVLCPGDYESSFISDRSFSYLPKKLQINEKIMNNDARRARVLLTTANSAYFDERELTEIIYLLNLTINQLKKLGVEFILRVFDESILQGIHNLHGSDIENDVKNTFEHVLSKVSSVITTPSSIVVTSMLADKPTCQLIYRDSPLFLQSGWMIHRSCDLKSTLLELINSNPERMSFQRNILKKNYRTMPLSKVIEKGNSKFTMKDGSFDINNEYRSMLESPYNINIEFFLRSLVKKFKLIKSRLIKK
ncbi:conserved hypothetical protein [Vibrio chagasii]|nr:conserved hypothetical protein [Vibrio chagasii]CAH6939492.1 conserved hypothetical protein [Vibrio chagasii]CAH7083126.1 conserved hypothetical protein [Vibrio chagasii]CAH7124142.1 conserved hypothetical protein [Vibrio chagasii]